MERQDKVVLTLDSYEHGIMIRALNELRNDLLEEQRDPGPVEDVLLKTIDAPFRGPFGNCKRPACGNEPSIPNRVVRGQCKSCPHFYCRLWAGHRHLSFFPAQLQTG